MRQVLLKPGDRVRLRLPYSEACMHMRVAGQFRMVELTDGPIPMAQILTDCGTPFSAPVTTGEAGIYHSPKGSYVNVEAGDVVYVRDEHDHALCTVSTSAWPVDAPVGGKSVEFHCVDHDVRWSRSLLPS